MTETILKVEGMSCGHCVARVEKALESVEGVKDAKVSLEKKEAQVDYDPQNTDIGKMKEAVEEAGYQVKE